MLYRALVCGDATSFAEPQHRGHQVVVHGRIGRNSDINGVYTRDYAWPCQVGPCYRRSGAAGQKTVFLYYLDHEWRMGPSPQDGSVWAFAQSDVASPVLINAPWEVWDGKRVERDDRLRISDIAVIPSALFFSLDGGADVPHGLRAMQGMLLQQPGLWDGRPYYRHQAWPDLFLLCSVAEGRWRFGPLPVLANGASRYVRPGASASLGGGGFGADLFSLSAAAIPQEIVEPWHVQSSDGLRVLPEGMIRLAGVAGFPAAPGLFARPQHYPSHLVLEGSEVAGALANGVYRRAADDIANRPVYHKADELRPASLWFSAGEWCIGASAPEGPTWACSGSAALSPLGIDDGPWRRLDRSVDLYLADDGTVLADSEEGLRIFDAEQVIPAEVHISGDRYVQKHQLCDARPVYVRDVPASGAPRQPVGADIAGVLGAGGQCSSPSGFSSCNADSGPAPSVGASFADSSSPSGNMVFLFYRVHEGEWWLGPTVGGIDCLARAPASRGRVLPVPQDLVWRTPSVTSLPEAPSWQRQQPLTGVASAAMEQPNFGSVDLAMVVDDKLASIHTASALSRTLQDWVWLLIPFMLILAYVVRAGLPLPKIVAQTKEAMWWIAAMVGDEEDSEEISTRVNTGSTRRRSKRASALACVVCFEAPREILLVPCRHVCCCKECADQLERCPMCRTPTTDFTKVFL